MLSSQRKFGFEGRRSCSSSTTTPQEYSSNYLMSWVGYLLLLRTLVPPEIQYILRQCWALFVRPYTSLFCVFHIYKRHKATGKKNDLFRLVELYLHGAGHCKQADEVVLSTTCGKEKDILYRLSGMKCNLTSLLLYGFQFISSN